MSNSPTALSRSFVSTHFIFHHTITATSRMKSRAVNAVRNARLASRRSIVPSRTYATVRDREPHQKVCVCFQQASASICGAVRLTTFTGRRRTERNNHTPKWRSSRHRIPPGTFLWSRRLHRRRLTVRGREPARREPYCRPIGVQVNQITKCRSDVGGIRVVRWKHTVRILPRSLDVSVGYL